MSGLTIAILGQYYYHSGSVFFSFFLFLQTFQKVFEIENISEDQKLQIQLALKGGCGVRSHDLKELQRLYVSSALLGAGPGLD